MNGRGKLVSVDPVLIPVYNGGHAMSLEVSIIEERANARVKAFSRVTDQGEEGGGGRPRFRKNGNSKQNAINRRDPHPARIRIAFRGRAPNE